MKRALLSFAFAVLASTAWADDCRADRVIVAGDWGRAAFTVTVADDSALRAQGLMHVDSMPQMAGMLFIYDQPQTVAFWMRNTLIPLDMLFADPDGLILHVHENAVPLDETPIPGGDGVQFVLEINGGMAARLGISAGDVMSHPDIGSPCAGS